MVILSKKLIETFMGITEATESTAIQTLEEHDGDLDDALIAHFGADMTMSTLDSMTIYHDLSRNNSTDIDNSIQDIPLASLSVIEYVYTPSIPDPNISRNHIESNEEYEEAMHEAQYAPQELMQSYENDDNIADEETLSEDSEDYSDDDDMSLEEEYHESLMLDAAIYNSLVQEENQVSYAPHLPARSERSIAPPESLVEQRTIRQQQDEEYLASLQADQEKEEALRAQEEAALEAERQKLEQENELERQLAEKEASLPNEPPADENAITLLVRMPDGSRLIRRFLKSDKLQLVFDFVDLARIVKPDTYRLVTTFPKRVFSNEKSDMDLNELGLTSKQETLFLELI